MNEIPRTIITLIGPKNTGKARMVYEVMDRLAARYGAAATSTPDTPMHGLSLVMELEHARLGFIPNGEPRTGFDLQLLDLAERQCQVIVCTARPRRATSAAVEALVNKYAYRHLHMTPIMEMPSTSPWRRPTKPAYAELVALGVEALSQLVEKVYAGVI